ncbi:hypothetical protein CBER1_02254 [Cercospora berteroae]|uniref:Uncharacterized protein n=1 Tax=Cercospora berteroae TaxID=357750 RepID=A0A2S6CB01_9PEZI|nr:hypothetical protein CBER1_02254 [Cercospora berteroae]
MFKGTIGGSTKLQRALWFKIIFDNQPLSSDRAQWDRAVLRVNPLFTKGRKKPFRFTASFGQYDPAARREFKFTITKAAFEGCNTGPAHSVPEPHASAAESPSWRRMLMLQSNPPIQYSTRISGLDFRGRVYLQYDELVTDVRRKQVASLATDGAAQKLAASSPASSLPQTSTSSRNADHLHLDKHTGFIDCLNMARVKNYERKEAALKEAARKDLALARAEKVASKAKAKKASRRKVGKDKEPSYEACYKVLYCPELLEIILLNVYDPRDAFPIQPSAEVNTKEKQEVKQGDTDEQSSNTGEPNRDVPGNGSVDEKDDYDEEEACRSMKTLLLSQRVHMFKDSIEGSTKLQQALWFTPLFDTETSSTSSVDEHKGPHITTRGNPLFSKSGGNAPEILSFENSSGGAYCTMSLQIGKFTFDIDTDSETSDTEEESWRLMLAAQSNRKVEYVTSVSGVGFKWGAVLLEYNDTKTVADLEEEADEEEEQQYCDQIDAEHDELMDILDCW